MIYDFHPFIFKIININTDKFTNLKKRSEPQPYRIHIVIFLLQFSFVLSTLITLAQKIYTWYLIFFPAAPGPRGWYLLLSQLLLVSCIATTCLSTSPLEFWHPVFISFFSSGGLEMFDQNLLTLNARNWECVRPLQQEKGGEQFDKVLLSLSVYIECTK